MLVEDCIAEGQKIGPYPPGETLLFLTFNKTQYLSHTADSILLFQFPFHISFPVIPGTIALKCQEKASQYDTLKPEAQELLRQLLGTLKMYVWGRRCTWKETSFQTRRSHRQST